MGLLNLEAGKENISPDKSEQTTFKLELQTQQETSPARPLLYQDLHNSSSSIGSGMDQWSPPPIPVLETTPAKDSSATPPSLDLPLCAGCRLRITDSFIMSCTERKWHSRCLKCVECGVELGDLTSGFEWHGQMFCKEDYHRLLSQSGKKCNRCLVDIHERTELVIQAKNFCFHLDCFRCTACDAVLKRGDHYAMVNNRIYCPLHNCGEKQWSQSPGGAGGHPLPMGGPHGQQPPFLPPHHMAHSDNDAIFPIFPHGGYPPPHYEHGWFPPGAEYPQNMGPIGVPQPAPSGDFPYDNNNEPVLKKRRGRKKRKVSESSFAAMNGYMDGSGFPGGPPGMDNQKTAKRARTSFKHHQLRIMKAHFHINQNPDSRELKMLSQKTCLDKKVLQVWFQNARAKWRRTKNQDGGTVPQGPHSAGSSDQEGVGGAQMGSPSTSSECAAANAMITCC